VVSKNVKNFTAQNAVRKMFFEEKFLKLIKKFFCTENANDAAVEAAERESLEGRLALINCRQTAASTRQQFAILKFEWAAINFQLLQTGIFNQCETTVFRKIIALLSIASHSK
jgi:hypothetical protein